MDNAIVTLFHTILTQLETAKTFVQLVTAFSSVPLGPHTGVSSPLFISCCTLMTIKLSIAGHQIKMFADNSVVVSILDGNELDQLYLILLSGENHPSSQSVWPKQRK